MKILRNLWGVLLTALFLFSCTKGDGPNTEGVAPLHKEVIHLAFEASLPTESLDPKFRSLILSDNGEALHKIDPQATTFTARLYFKKMGVSGLGTATVTYNVARVNNSVKLHYYGQATFTGNFSAGVHPGDGGEWYVAGVMGGGDQLTGNDFYKVTFDRKDEDYERTDTKVRMPLLSKWTKMFNENGASAINGHVGYTSMHYEPQGAFIRVNLTTEQEFKAGPTWASVVTEAVDASGYFDFSAGSDTDVRSGKYPSWRATNSASPTLLNFKLQDQQAGQMKTYYVWGMPRSGVQNPETTVEAGFLNFVKSGTTETFRSTTPLQNGVSYPINLTLTEAGAYSVLRPLFRGAFLNPQKNGTVAPTKDELQANMDMVGYFNVRELEARGFDFAFDNKQYEVPDEFQWTSVFAGYDAGLVVGGSNYPNWSRDQNMQERVGSIQRTFYDQFKYNVSQINKLYALKFQAYNASKGLVYSNKSDLQTAYPQAKTDAQRVALRYTYNDPQGPDDKSNPSNFDIGELKIEAVPLGVDDPRTGKSAITINTVFDDAWWTQRQQEGVVRTVTLLFPGVKVGNNWRAVFDDGHKFRGLLSRVKYGRGDENVAKNSFLLIAVHTNTLENSNFPTGHSGTVHQIAAFLFNKHH